jgi:hypothetical protein
MPFFGSPDHLEPHYREAYDQWKTRQDPPSTAKLLRAVRPEIQRGISIHVGRANPLLTSRARRLAVQAIQTYDPKRGAKLGTHIVNQLQGLKRITRQQTQILRMPERVSLEQNRVRLAEQELLDDLGRDPTLSELADYTGLSIKRLKHIQRFVPAVAEGTFRRQFEEGEGSLPAVAVPGQEDPWIELVYHDLSPVNQKVLEWSTGFHGVPELSNEEIARRLHITPGAVSQRKNRIQALLNEGLERNLI